MKPKLTIFILVVLALLVTGCSALSPAEPTATPTPIPPTATPEPSPMPSPIPTETPIPSPTLLPTVAPVDIGAAGVLEASEFSITPPPSIGTADWKQVPGTPYDPNTPPSLNGLPSHLLVTFDQDQVDPNIFDINQRQGRILPVQAYLSMYAQAGVTQVQDSINSLQEILKNKPDPISGSIPVLPGVNAVQSLHAKVKYLDFAGGTGVAFLASYSQDVSPITNERLYYFFQGLSADGQQYVSFVFPVASNSLPNTAADVTPETQAALEADPSKYLADTTAALEQAAPSDFTPDLSQLDSMYQSIRIGALPPTATPAPAGPPIAGTSWFWRSFIKADGSQTTITEYDNYSIQFLDGGMVSVLADCNKGSGTYRTTGTQISIQVTATTQASCGAESLGSQYVNLLNASFAYAVQNGVLALFSNDGTMNFGPTVVTTGTPTAGTGTPVPVNGPVGPIWYWISFQGADGSNLTISDPDQYTLQLLANGSVNIKADCNTASGTYTLSGSNLKIDVQSSTKVACPQGSLSDQYLNYLDSSVSYSINNNNRLNLALSDGSNMRFSQ
jgi:heat shock protein HslJ